MTSVRRALAIGALGLVACAFDTSGGGATGATIGDASSSSGVASTQDPTESTSADSTSDGGPGSGSGVLPGSESGSSSTGVVDDSGTSSSGAGESSTGEAPIPVGPFGDPEAIDALNSPQDDDDPSVTADELFIVFNSARSGTSDIWWSERDAITDDWDPPQTLAAFNVGYTTGPAVSPDGLVLVWGSNAAPATSLDVWIATREDRTSAWSDAQILGELSSPGADIAPRWHEGLGVAILCSDRPGGEGLLDPWAAAWPMPSLTPDTPVHVPELATGADDCAIGLASDGREIFIETTRPGGPGGWDLWRGHRDDPLAPYDEAMLAPVPELDTLDADVDPWLSDDSHRIYFASDRNDAGFDLFVAER